MLKLLCRLLSGKAEPPQDPAVRDACGRTAGIIGIDCNFLLFAGKLAIGLFTHSLSITADAINNLSDASGSLATLIGFKLAAKPADEKHPFGHRRMEYFSGLLVAVMILLIGAELLKSSVKKIIVPGEVGFSAVVVVILSASILIKTLMALFYARLGKKISSSALRAAAADSRNDVIATAAVLASGIFGYYTGLAVDGYVGLLVALFILFSGIGIARETISPLLGEAPDEELVHRIGFEIRAHEKVLGIHDFIMHDYGPGRRFASVHVEMDYRTDPLEAHERMDEIEREVKEKTGVELVVHYDPIVVDDPELNAVRLYLREALKGTDERLCMHDFRMVRGQRRTNIIFDLVIPREYEARKKELNELIAEKLKEMDPKYHAIVSFDATDFNDPHTVRDE